jgi:ribosomal protein S18 acetylase RimI-like enzyme
MNIDDPSHNSKYSIVPASWRDLNALRQLEKICFPKDQWPLIDLLGVLAFANVVRLKATIDSVMVGFIAGDTRTTEKMGWISTVSVLPAYRKRGIGSALIRACEEQLNVRCVRLNVRISNKAAIHLYRTLGYQEVTIWPDYYNDKEDALVLEIHIKP